VSAPAVAEIRTERLILRPIAAEDVPPFAHMLADPQVVRFISDGSTATQEETAEWVELSIRRNAFEGFDKRSVVLAENESVLGWCGIAVWNIEGTIERELGYVLAREHWGQGYATEAAAAMRDLALSTLGLRRVIALIHAGNDASKHVARKLGFAYERDAEFHGRTVELFALEA
jgi:RimJ/RimL family protein N-acetyltransferase